MIRLNNISKSFGDKLLFKDFSYNFDTGIICITGESGCGKTTLLNIIAGLVAPDEGAVTADGGKLRMVFQEPRLLDWCTVLQNVCIKSDDKIRASELLENLMLQNEENSYPDKLSGGMRQRVAIARALCDNPDILLLDEPFNGLDEATVQTAINVIKENMQGKLVICVSHNLDIVEQIADKIIKL
ncbi:MAG: ABC transporter ATP-binding protein [Clostridia bacterium]|nr:ABC transporter ATP-binding protein [Clostridia bacterium]